MQLIQIKYSLNRFIRIEYLINPKNSFNLSEEEISRTVTVSMWDAMPWLWVGVLG